MALESMDNLLSFSLRASWFILILDMRDFQLNTGHFVDYVIEPLDLMYTIRFSWLFLDTTSVKNGGGPA